MPKIQKGEHTPLNVTQKSRHRVYVGLGWDPNERISLLDKTREIIGGKKTHHDLDLSCYIYDDSKNLIDVVSADPKNAIDQSGQVYHSGDNPEGFGDGDDEQISVELKELPANIHHLLFLATVESGHTFEEINTPEIRLVDGYSEHTFLQTPISQKAKTSAFVFVNLHKTSSGWSIHHIGEFLAENNISHWSEALKKHL